MRTFRSARSARPARLLAATGVALAALALTACDNGTGTRDEGSSGGSTSTSQTTGSSGTTTGGTTSDKASSKTGTNTDTGGSTSGGTGTDKKSPNGKTGGSAASSDPFDPANRVTCNGSNTTVTLQTVARPLNHMLITVKNTGTKVCDLYYNPSVRFGEAQSAPRVIEESQPQAVVTLAPGESGYAGVLLSAADGSGEGGSTEKKAVIHFQGKKSGSDGGAPASPALPAKGVYVDSTVAVTYWQSTVDDALMY